MNSKMEKPNSGDHRLVFSGTEETLHLVDNASPPDPPGAPLLLMRTGIFEFGRNRSWMSGTTTPVPEDISSLEDHARSMARNSYRDRFDPEKNVHDRMHQAEYERLLEVRGEIEKGVAQATANVHESELVLANTGKAGPKPQASGWLAAAFVVALTITIAPTLHDFLFFGIPDELLAWFTSSICAAFVASMLTLAILSGRKTQWTWIGVVAGIGLGMGLGALRLSSAKGMPEVLFAMGLTVVEVSAVLLLEWLASGLRHREDEWQLIKSAEDKAAALLSAELVDLERREKRLREVNEAIGRKIAQVEDRSVGWVPLPELEACATKAVLDGYYSGIAENIGRLRGAPRRQP